MENGPGGLISHFHTSRQCGSRSNAYWYVNASGVPGPGSLLADNLFVSASSIKQGTQAVESSKMPTVPSRRPIPPDYRPHIQVVHNTAAAIPNSIPVILRVGQVNSFSGPGNSNIEDNGGPAAEAAGGRWRRKKKNEHQVSEFRSTSLFTTVHAAATAVDARLFHSVPAATATPSYQHDLFSSSPASAVGIHSCR